MKSQRVLAVTVTAVALAMLLPAVAVAQDLVVVVEKPYGRRALPAPAQAFELTVGTGYTQGFGNLQSGVGLPTVATAGVGVDASIGYRIDPHYGISVGGEYQELQSELDDGVRAFTLTIALQYHVVPHARFDPWLELGSGYRLLWLVPRGPSPTTVLNGPQLLRLRAGLDMRVSRELAIAPVIGADATMFIAQDDGAVSAISDPTLSTFVFAGLQGRIDIGGR